MSMCLDLDCRNHKRFAELDYLNLEYDETKICTFTIETVDQLRKSLMKIKVPKCNDALVTPNPRQESRVEVPLPPKPSDVLFIRKKPVNEQYSCGICKDIVGEIDDPDSNVGRSSYQFKAINGYEAFSKHMLEFHATIVIAIEWHREYTQAEMDILKPRFDVRWVEMTPCVGCGVSQ